MAISAEDAKYFDYFLTEVRGNTLYISYKGNTLIGNKGLKAIVKVPTLSAISGSGAARIKLEGNFWLNELDLKLSDACDFNGNISGNSIQIQAAGSCNINIQGTVKSMKADASGSSDINAKKLLTEDAQITASGASNIYTHVSKSIKANSTGASSIWYSGNPIQTSFNSTGASTIKVANKG